MTIITNRHQGVPYQTQADPVPVGAILTPLTILYWDPLSHSFVTVLAGRALAAPTFDALLAMIAVVIDVGGAG